MAEQLAIVGPTASGKSAVAMSFARRRIAAGSAAEIVSCDSMQVYRGMDIGTAKPSRADRAEVPHHMIDLVEPSVDHDLPQFLASARGALAGVGARGSAALLVGGTGLYVRALVDGFDPPPHFPEIAAELEASGDTQVLSDRLELLDPMALSRIPPGNRRRIVRALEVCIGTGKRFSEHGGDFGSYPPSRIALFGLLPEREAMTESIDRRLEDQMARGFLEEVRELAGAPGGLSRNASQALGYRDLLEHLRGSCDLASAVASSKVRTRRFALRQLRWFSRDPRIVWLEPPRGGERTPEDVAQEIEAHLAKPGAGVDPAGSSFAPSGPEPRRP